MPQGKTPSAWLQPGVLVWLATAGALALTGFWRMFAHFPGYDDEGYIMFSVRDYLQHGDLYGTVYSQYGPAFYLLVEAIHRVTGTAIDHGFVRWFTLTFWLGTAAGMAGLVMRNTASRSAAWFAAVAAFLFLFQFSEEAFHPGVVVVCLLPAAAWGIQELVGSGRLGWAAALAGAAAAGLALLKINVGVLFAAGAGLWLLLTGRDRKMRGLGIAAGGLFATALMHGLISAGWVRIFLVVLTAGLIGVGRVSQPRTAAGSWRILGPFVAGAVGVTGGVVFLAGLRGTSVRALWEGVILGPLGHADAYSFAIDWRPGTLVLAAVALGALAVFRALLRRERPAAAASWLVALRGIHLVALLVMLVLLGHFRVVGVLFSYTIPWLWLWVARMPGAAPAPGKGARELVACILLLQLLHAYPVGGIQICWGSFLLFALVALALPETGNWLRERSGSGRFARFLPQFLCVVLAAKAAATAWEYRATYLAKTDLGLPGTAGLRLSQREVVAYQTLVTNAVVHADRLFSLPGMFSFNLWSEVPAPTTRNTTVWYSLLTEKEQQAIVTALEQARRPALIVDGALIVILQASGAPPRGPLYAYLMAAYRPAFSFGGLGFWVKQGRGLAPIGTAWRPAADGGALLQACLIGTGEPITALEISTPDDPAKPRRHFDGRNARVTIEPLRLDGTASAAPAAVTWPFRFDGLARLTVYGGDAGAAPEPEQLLELKTAGTHRGGQALFVDGK